MSNIVSLRVATKLTYESGHTKLLWWTDSRVDSHILGTDKKEEAKLYKLSKDLMEALEEYSLLFDEKPHLEITCKQLDLFNKNEEKELVKREVYIELVDPLLE